MKAIQTFNHKMFGQIRTMTQENGQIMFVGKDVATALGYSKPQNALATHVDKEDKSTAPIQGTAYETRAVLINESGLYALVLSSKLPQAKAFKRWVTSEVLPQIRMTGGYIPTKDSEGRELSAMEIVKMGQLITGATLKVFNDRNKNCLTATEVAKLWGMEVRAFNHLLCKMDIQYRLNGVYRLTEELENEGLAEERMFLSYSLNGMPKTRTYLVWTPKGVNFLEESVRQLKN